MILHKIIRKVQKNQSVDILFPTVLSFSFFFLLFSSSFSSFSHPRSRSLALFLPDLPSSFWVFFLGFGGIFFHFDVCAVGASRITSTIATFTPTQEAFVVKRIPADDLFRSEQEYERIQHVRRQTQHTGRQKYRRDIGWR